MTSTKQFEPKLRLDLRLPWMLLFVEERSEAEFRTVIYAVPGSEIRVQTNE